MENSRKHAGFIRELRLRYKIIPLFLDDGFIPFTPEFDTGIDLIVYREHDDLLIKIQLKSRWSIDRKYIGRGIAVAFPGGSDDDWYLIPHDLMVDYARSETTHLQSDSWLTGGLYHRASMSQSMKKHFQSYKLGDASLNETIFAYYKGARNT